MAREVYDALQSLQFFRAWREGSVKSPSQRMRSSVTLGLAILVLLAGFACRREDPPITGSKPQASGSLPSAPAPSASQAVLTPNDGGLRVVEETDESSSRGHGATPSSCEAKAAEVVNALPAVKRAVSGAMKDAERSHGAARFGGVGPNDDGQGGFAASMGIQTNERFEARVDYAVDRNGRLTVTVLGADVQPPRDALQSVAQACRH
jgi:hypothetical protein